MEDGTDAFGIYENGGAAACHAYWMVKAHNVLGRKEEARLIFCPLLKSYAACGFQGRSDNGLSKDWKNWRGDCWGCEGFPMDVYRACSLCAMSWRDNTPMGQALFCRIHDLSIRFATLHCKVLYTVYSDRMDNRPIEAALDQVRCLRDLVIRRRRFHGYSGRARMVCGVLALLHAAILSSRIVPETNLSHLLGWGIVLALALAINYGAVAWWFVSHPDVRRQPALLKPALDAVPALAAGGVLTIALISAQHYDLLFGSWMLMYGLAQTTYRSALPRGVYWTGLVYMVCGALLLVRPVPFTQPWSMGVVFILGEMAGGICLLNPEED